MSTSPKIWGATTALLVLSVGAVVYPADAGRLLPAAITATPVGPATATAVAVRVHPPTAPTATTPVPPAPVSPVGPVVQPSNRIMWRGSSTFLTGVNVPWITWPYAPGHGDFGGGATDGVIANAGILGTAFDHLRQAGVHVVRWWTFEQEAWPVNRDANGRPTSLNPVVFADFDAALALANQYDLYYDFVLFGNGADFPSTWRTDPAQRAQLATVLGPLFARYKDNPRVMTWEIFNEPEWQIWFGDGSVKEADISAMASAVIVSIRSNAPSTLVTVGSALIEGYNASQHGLSMWTSVDLDYYSPHWYNVHVSPPEICALCTTAPALQAKYGTSKPIVIGEFEEGSGPTPDNVARLNQWYDQGYAGAWGWSLFPQYTGDGFVTDLAAYAIFDAAHTDIGPRTP